MKDIAALYDYRFDAKEREMKNAIWKVLCEDFFQQYIGEKDHLLEIACGFGEFSNHIRAGKKTAVDLNESVQSSLAKDVSFRVASAHDLGMIPSAQVDVCFVSNFFEHLPNKDAMDSVLSEVYRVLKPGGRLIAMQPNIKYCGKAYWDFYDHHLPLSHLSAAEGFVKNGFRVTELVPRFLPFTTKSKYPKSPILIRLYIKMPFAWRIFGQQFLIVGQKP